MKSITEQRNPQTMSIDDLETVAVLQLINQQDQEVPTVLSHPQLLKQMGLIVDQMAQTYQNKGRIFYLGAGTSGRLGVLDAVELVPTYGIAPDEFISLMAGGPGAMYVAVEGAEDDPNLAVHDLKEHHFQKGDFLIGIAASGRTPYVIGGLDYAQEIGVKTASIACNPQAIVSEHATFPIEAVVGPEVITGSTRMKAGTVQKLILNMLSTATMIKCGKVYGNLMVDLKATNLKLIERSKRIVQEATGVSFEKAETIYLQADCSVKVAIIMISCNVDQVVAQDALEKNSGRVALAIAALAKKESF